MPENATITTLYDSKHATKQQHFMATQIIYQAIKQLNRLSPDRLTAGEISQHFIQKALQSLTSGNPHSFLFADNSPEKTPFIQAQSMYFCHNYHEQKTQKGFSLAYGKVLAGVNLYLPTEKLNDDDWQSLKSISQNSYLIQRLDPNQLTQKSYFVIPLSLTFFIPTPILPKSQAIFTALQKDQLDQKQITEWLNFWEIYITSITESLTFEINPCLFTGVYYGDNLKSLPIPSDNTPFDSSLYKRTSAFYPFSLVNATDIQKAQNYKHSFSSFSALGSLFRDFFSNAKRLFSLQAEKTPQADKDSEYALELQACLLAEYTFASFSNAISYLKNEHILLNPKWVDELLMLENPKIGKDFLSQKEINQLEKLAEKVENYC